MSMSRSDTKTLVQSIWDGGYNSATLTSRLGYYKGHLGMKNYTMLPTQVTKTYFLTTCYWACLALSWYNGYGLLLDAQGAIGNRKDLFLCICKSNFVLSNSHSSVLISHLCDLGTC